MFMASLSMPIPSSNTALFSSLSVFPFRNSISKTCLRIRSHATSRDHDYSDDQTGSEIGENISVKFDRRKALVFLGAACRILSTNSWAFAASPVFSANDQVFPLTVDKTVIVSVNRPKKSRSKREKEEEEEVLEIEGIQYNKGDFVKFDVYVNEDSPEGCSPDKTEFLGSFVNVSHGRRSTNSMISAKTKTCFGLNDVLEDLGAEDFEDILVTIVPKKGVVTISGINIKFDDYSTI